MFRQFVRRFATLQKTGKPESTVLKDPVRQVFISQSNDVFTNLALEDWLYRHHDFAHKVRSQDQNLLEHAFSVNYGMSQQVFEGNFIQENLNFVKNNFT